MALIDTWRYDGGDPSILLFDWALREWRMEIEGDVVEIGACETDFLERLAAAGPRLRIRGFDQRPRYYGGHSNAECLQVDVLDPLFIPGAVDWVVSLGTVEHIGLGYYGDRVDPEGDTHALEMFAAAGAHSMYFDVPWTPRGYFVSSNAHWRCYDDGALEERLVPPGFAIKGLAYSDCDPIRVRARPDLPPPFPQPFYYAMMWIQRARRS